MIESSKKKKAIQQTLALRAFKKHNRVTVFRKSCEHCAPVLLALD